MIRLLTHKGSFFLPVCHKSQGLKPKLLGVWRDSGSYHDSDIGDSGRQCYDVKTRNHPPILIRFWLLPKLDSSF